MRKFKIIFLVLILFVLSGCEAEYNMQIDQSDSILERIDIVDDLNDYTDPSSESFNRVDKYLTDTTLPNIGYYKSPTYIEKGNLGGLRFDQKYSINDFAANPYIKSDNLVNYTVKKDKNKIRIYTNSFNVFNKYPIDSLTINMSSGYKVVSNNADNISNGVYSWYINLDNYETKIIDFTIDTSKDIKDERLLKSDDFINENAGERKGSAKTINKIKKEDSVKPTKEVFSISDGIIVGLLIFVIFVIVIIVLRKVKKDHDNNNSF